MNILMLLTSPDHQQLMTSIRVDFVRRQTTQLMIDIKVATNGKHPKYAENIATFDFIIEVSRLILSNSLILSNRIKLLVNKYKEYCFEGLYSLINIDNLKIAINDFKNPEIVM